MRHLSSVDSFFFLSKSLNTTCSLQAVSNPAHGFDQASDVPELLPKPFDVSVSRSRFERAWVVPDGLQQVLAAAHQSPVTGEIDEELELQGRESDDLTVGCHLVPRHVDAESIKLEPVDGLLSLGMSARTRSISLS